MAATADSAAIFSINLSGPMRVVQTPSASGDPIPTVLTYGSGEMLGVAIR